MTAAVWAAGVVLAASSKKTTSGGSATFLIVLVLLGLAGYFLFLRPQQQKARKQKALQSDIGVGDEVLTVGGIVGTVLSIDSERVTILTGMDRDGSSGGEPPTRMVLVRNAIARKIEPAASPAEDATEPSGGHPGYGGLPEADHAGSGDGDDHDPHDVGEGEGTTTEGGGA
ncbi:MAG: preprotein translocase subunit YajC [Acidimicrobiales bacterium]